MSHGERAARRENKRRDYWAPRPGNRGGGTKSPITKALTHRVERRRAKDGTRKDTP